MASRRLASPRRNRVATPFLAVLVALAAVVVLIRRGYIPYNQREVNKRFVNPLMLRFAGGSRSPQAVIYHTGRKSGKDYATPVAVDQIADGFLIPMPYGTDVDWSRNLLAAGHGTIRLHGITYPVTEPAVIDVATALPLLPPNRQRLWRALGIKHALKLERASVPTLPSKLS